MKLDLFIEKTKSLKFRASVVWNWSMYDEIDLDILRNWTDLADRTQSESSQIKFFRNHVMKKRTMEKPCEKKTMSGKK